MTILDWDKPERARPAHDHNEYFVADGLPPGAYVPNMSHEHSLKWKAKYTHNRSQVEIRKSWPDSQMLIIVGKEGYDYRQYKRQPDQWGRSTQGYNVHISLNGPAQMTFEEFGDMVKAVQEAKVALYMGRIGMGAEG